MGIDFDKEVLMKSIYTVPGKLDVYWEEDAKAVIDIWKSYFITLPEFKEATLGQGLAYAKRHGGVAYIVDSSQANGVFTQDIQNFIDSDIFPSYAKGGIKYFINITPQSAVTKLTVANYTSKLGPHGIQLVNAENIESAVEWLKQNI